SKKISESAKESWRDDDKCKNQLAHRKKRQFKDRISRWSKGKWADATYRSKQLELRSSDTYVVAASERSKALWRDAEYRKKITEVLDKARPQSVPPRISSLQLLLYSVLDDIGIEYYPEGPETIIGPVITSNSRFEGYSWDCCIIHNNKRIYIDVHGDYWHRENREHRDRAKATFLKKYFPQHDILIIWEHEFRGVNNIRRIILDKLGISKTIQVDFDFKEIEINQIDISNELKALFANYHYLGNIGRFGSFRAGAVLSDKLVAAAAFGYPTRKESTSRLGLNSGQLFELSRFCIHGSYQKRNFASWFLARSTKMVWDQFPKVKILLTFADTTNGHTGTIYKAAGWKFDGEVRPSYWYVDGGGAWYHKKSIWDLAIKNSISEHDYAASRGLMKISGGKKLRFLLSKI
ncbi:MAG TPA: hypothetical protein VFI27_22615, partial [candidate division Zixibacteria bacterium]|nr:hypothetical protein [candidate division Zixibacteria bacterium]